MCNISVSNRGIREDPIWRELHDSETAKKHRGQLTKARQMIQEDIETKCYA